MKASRYEDRRYAHMTDESITESYSAPGRSDSHRRLRPKRRTARVSAIASALLAVAMMGTTALAAPRAVDDPNNLIQNVKTPPNASLNLYDYWISAPDAPDDKMPTGWRDLGINKGHQFWFGNADHNPSGEPAGSGSINAWTQGTKPYAGVVQNRLRDGYPVLAAGHRYDNTNKPAMTVEEPLAYLFDSTEFEGKKVYANVDGLVQYENGYYTYDSFKNFASLDKETGDIALYKKPSVEATGKYSGTGQFFPFNSGSDVFYEAEDGTLTKKNLKSTNQIINHYFGAELTVNFTQPRNGMVAGDEMQFHFAGDDDVWLFIDGVLVGDLGGIHGASKLDINFKSGVVTISDTGKNGWQPQETTIRSAFEAALGEEEAARYLESGKNTLRNDSYHTMKFFYLERGNTDSNMALTFNLQRVTQNTIQKTDQFGAPIANAEFELWAAEKAGNDYVCKPNGLIARSTTGVSGSLTFMTPDGSRPLNFEEAHASGYNYFVLKETKSPDGYRKASDAWLRYVESKGDRQDGFLVCDNPWNAGVYARPSQVTYVNESNVVWSTNRDGAGEREFNVTDDVTLLAVIYKRDRKANDWHPVIGRYGNWSVGEPVTSYVDLNELYRLQAARPFTHENDAWSVDLGDLPGSVLDYRFMAAQNDEDVSYSVGYYLVDMPKAKLDEEIKAGRNPITNKNAFELESFGRRGNFIRESYAKFAVTDQLNTLTVQKLDDAGNPVRGAVFALYRADQMQADEHGSLVPKPGATAFAEKTTEDLTDKKAIGLDGAAYFTGMPIVDQAYGTDTYYLVEKSAPTGYVVDSKPVRILVDWSGVYADAGAKDDGVTVSAGVGSLIDSMDHYGSNDGIEVTLHDVIAEKAVATDIIRSKQGDHFYYVAGWAPTDGEGDEPDLYLRYDDEGNFHDYIENEFKPENQRNGVDFTTDEGVIRAHVRQDPEPCADQHGIGTWDDWDEWPVTNLFTGETVVHVTNQRVASLEVEKQIRIPDGLQGPADAADMSFTFVAHFMKDGAPLAGEYTARVFKRDANDGSEVQVGPEFALKNNGTFTLKHGETLKVYGLPDGATYRIEEQKTPTGFEQSNPADAAGKPTPAEGSIVIGKPDHRVFVNTYRPTPAVMSDTVLGVRKDFISKDGDGDPWEMEFTPEAEFAFVLEAITDGAPMPDGSKPDEGGGVVKATVTIGKDDKSNNYTEQFAPVRFNAPGVYEYSVHERTPAPADRIPGVTYSDAAYRVTVTVVDGRDGSLDASVAVVQTADDAGNPILPNGKPVKPQGDGYVVPFQNVLERKATQLGPLASKTLTGRDFMVDPNGTGEFIFRMEPVGPHADTQPMPDSAQGSGAQRYVEVKNNGDSIAFGQSTYTHDDVASGPFYYELFEVIPGEATNASGVRYDQASPEQKKQGGFTLNGVTYDGTHYIAEVSLSMEGEHNEIVVGKISYYEGSWTGSVDDLKPVPLSESGANRVWFENSYTSNGSYQGIQVTKTLIGRDMQDGEFAFSIEGADKASQEMLAKGDESFEAPAAEHDVTVIMGPKLQLSFTQANAGRTYSFRVREAVPQDSALPGIAYDRSEYLVEYKVVDDLKGSVHVEPRVFLERDASGGARYEQLDVSVITSPETGLISLDFSNMYHANAVHGGIEVAKTLSGRPMRKGEFKFRLEPVNEWSAKKMDERGLSLEDATAEKEFSAGKAADGVADVMKKLSGLTFTQDDIYTANAATRQFSYDVWEVVDPQWDDDQITPGIQRCGVTFDRSRFRVTITPIDDGDGSLHLETKVERTHDKTTGEVLNQPEFIGTWSSDQSELPRIPFSNTYTAQGSISAWMPFNKRLSGRDWLPGDTFSFAIEQELYREPLADGGYKDWKPGEAGYVGVGMSSPIDVTVQNPELNGNHLFGPTSDAFVKPGVYRYKVYEVIPADAVNAQGTRYDQASDEEKERGGFTKNGITYSNRTVHFALSALDYGMGTLVLLPTITEKPDNDGAYFANTYSGGDATCSLDGLFAKELIGREWLDTDSFTFELKAENPADAPMPAGSSDGVARASVTKGDAQDGTAAFGFGSIVYGMQDLDDVAPGVDGSRSKQFTYKVSEVIPETSSNNGIAFDTHEATVCVTLTDDGKGSLSATPAITSSVAGGVFTNVYTAAPASASLRASKVYDGAPLKAGEFQFKLANTEAPQGVTLAQEQVKANAADGSVVFDAMRYDRPGVWKYAISEVLPDGVDADHPVKNGITYDTSVHMATVAVQEDKLHGVLQASVSYGDAGVDQGAPEFHNGYQSAPVADELRVKKTVSATPGNAFTMKGGEFSFELRNTSAPNGVTPLQTQVKHNDAAGGVAFDALTFENPGTYLFALSEQDVKDAPGISKDGTVYIITYTIEDNGQGQLVIADKSVMTDDGAAVDGGAVIPFENTYDPQAVAYEISGGKRIENTDAGTDRVPADGEFSFTLKALGGTVAGQDVAAGDVPMPEGSAGGSKTVSNTGSVFSFGPATYDVPGTYRYEVREEAGVDASIAFDETLYSVEIRVDDVDGALTVQASYKKAGVAAEEVLFTNSYTPIATDPVALGGHKTLQGRDLVDGEFAFTLRALVSEAAGHEIQPTDVPMPDGSSLGSKTVKNAGGAFSFGGITFDKTGVYRYEVIEESGDGGGVTYDQRIYSATVVVVEDRETHQLRSSVTYAHEGEQVDAPMFENTYTALPVALNLTAHKVMIGRDLKEGEFSFALRVTGPDGQRELKATNDAAGQITFPEVFFSIAGTYELDVYEVAGESWGVTYDDAVHHATVQVVDAGDGHLTIQDLLWVDGVYPTFKNVYTPSGHNTPDAGIKPDYRPHVGPDENGGGELPKTGDMPWAMLAAGAAIACILTSRVFARKAR